MWPDWVSNPGLLTYDSGALPTALGGLPILVLVESLTKYVFFSCSPYAQQQDFKFYVWIFSRIFMT